MRNNIVLSWALSICIIFGFSPNVIAVQLTLGDATKYDYSYESGKVSCVDVAVVNMFNYIDSEKKIDIVDSSSTIKEQQENFHKIYDPKFEKSFVDALTTKNAIEDHIKQRKLTGEVKVFKTKDLSYNSLITEWKNGELIILFSFIQNLLGTPGHALFLWGLDDDTENPKISVVDPLIHPNTNHKIAEENYFDTKSGGTSTWANLTLGKDNIGPYWDMDLTSPKYDEYKLADGSIYEYPESTYKHRIRGFLSVSDVKPIPEPSSMILLGIGMVGLVRIGRKKLKKR